MTKAAQELHSDDEIVTLSEDGATAETKKAPTAEELAAAAKAKAASGDEDEDSGEDERHAADAGGTDEEIAARKSARSAARKARKQHRREREDATKAENEELRGRLAALEGRVSTVTATSHGQVIATVDTRLSEAANACDLADAALEEAISKQDGKGAREALKTRDLAIEAIRQLTDYKARYEASTKQPAVVTDQGPGPKLLSFAKQFKADNPWVEFNPDHADDDSQAVHRLDASVKAAGYDPNTPEYWEELQDRVDRKFPAKLTAMADDDDEEERPARRSAVAAAPGAAARRGPAMGGGRSAATLGKNDIVIPAAVKKAAQEAGYWNDPKERADFIKRWRASSEKYSAAK